MKFRIPGTANTYPITFNFYAGHWTGGTHHRMWPRRVPLPVRLLHCPLYVWQMEGHRWWLYIGGFEDGIYRPQKHVLMLDVFIEHNERPAAPRVFWSWHNTVRCMLAGAGYALVADWLNSPIWMIGALTAYVTSSYWIDLIRAETERPTTLTEEDSA